jgi:hypothetical protein
MFPVEEEAAVINFTAEVDGRTIKTQVKKKEEARQEYDKAMEVGNFGLGYLLWYRNEQGCQLIPPPFIFCPFNRDRREVWLSCLKASKS